MIEVRVKRLEISIAEFLTEGKGDDGPRWRVTTTTGIRLRRHGCRDARVVGSS